MTAQITFPDRPGAASAPVRPHPAKRSSVWPWIAVAVPVVVAAVAMTIVVVRRRLDAPA